MQQIIHCDSVKLKMVLRLYSTGQIFRRPLTASLGLQQSTSAHTDVPRISPASRPVSTPAADVPPVSVPVAVRTGDKFVFQKLFPEEQLRQYCRLIGRDEKKHHTKTGGVVFDESLLYG